MLLTYFLISVFATTIMAVLNLGAGIALCWIIPVSFIACFLGLVILQGAVFAIVTLLIDVKKPPSKFSKIYRVMVNCLLKVLVPLLNAKVHVTGKEKIPTGERFLLVSNHLHDIDPAVFFYALPKAELAFVGKKEIYETMKFVAKAMHMLLGLPLDRENNRNAVVTINKASKIIKEDKASVAIFPEGYVSKTGELLEFRNGAFKIAKKAECAVVVATLKNTKQLTKNMFFKRTNLYVDILEVIPKNRVAELSTQEIGEIAHTLMYNKINN